MSYNNGNSTALSGTDYTAHSNHILTFAPGETVKTVQVPITNDTSAEPAESFYAVLSSPSANAVLGNNVAVATIVDNDGASDMPGLSIVGNVVDESAGIASVTFRLDHAATSNVTANYAVQGLTAAQGADFTAGSQNAIVSFAPGETVKTATFGIINDTATEDSESFSVSILAVSGATLGTGTATITLAANDGPISSEPVISVADAIATEAGGFVDCLVTLDAPSASRVSVSFQTVAGSATSSDFSGYVETMTFAPGETLLVARIPITQDALAESLEGFTFQLLAPVGATLGKSTATVQIIDSNSALANPPSLVGSNVADILQGTDAPESLSGLDGNDILNGGAGADTMTGGMGDDTYVIDQSGDVVVENAGEGTDTVYASVSHTLAANVENLVLMTGASNGGGNALANLMTGNAAANLLAGAAGNDTLNGGAGADSLYGGLGDDVYYRDNAGDVIVESAGEGTDTVYGSVNTTLAANVENLMLQTGASNGGGNAQANVITGNAAANLLAGAAGNDSLNGGAGADSLYGGTGDDSYYRDNAGDLIVENAGEGTDSVYTSVSYSLAANVENLMLQTGAANGGGNALANVLTGNATANLLAGAAGNDSLNGGAGADSLYGGTGDDIYYRDNAGDVIVENLGEGVDTVYSSLNYTLAANVENIVLTGSATNAGGNALGNSMSGNALNNLLSGAAGADTLIGGLGNDTLYSGADADRFVFDTTPNSTNNVDTIADWAAGDSIALDNDVFTALGTAGGMNATQFTSGAGLTGASVAGQVAGIYYDSSTGKLYYDADGFGGVAAVQFATLTTKPSLTAASLVVVE